MSDDSEALYAMELSEEIDLWRGCSVVRVPGGWLYRFDNESVGGHWTTSTAFVPFSDEFKPVENNAPD